MSENKEYIEPEIVREKKDDTKFSGDYEENNMQDQIKGIKRALLLKGLTSLIVPILIFLLVLSGIIALVFILFANPFDYIISGIILFYLFKALYKFIKIFIK